MCNKADYSLFPRFSQDMLLIDGSLPLALLNTAAGMLFKDISSFHGGLIMAAAELLTCIMQVALIATAAGFVAISYPFLVVILYTLQRYYLRTSKQIRSLDLEAKSPLYSHCIETISGLVTIRAFHWQRKVLDDSHCLLDASQKPYYYMFCIQRWLNLVLDLIIAALAVIVMGVAVGTRNRSGTTSIGVALVNITTLGETFRNLIISWTSLETSLAAVSRLQTFSRDTPCETLPTRGAEPRAEWPSSGAIDFFDVSVSYMLVRITTDIFHPC